MRAQKICESVSKCDVSSDDILLVSNQLDQFLFTTGVCQGQKPVSSATKTCYPWSPSSAQPTTSSSPKLSSLPIVIIIVTFMSSQSSSPSLQPLTWSSIPSSSLFRAKREIHFFDKHWEKVVVHQTKASKSKSNIQIFLSITRYNFCRVPNGTWSKCPQWWRDRCAWRRHRATSTKPRWDCCCLSISQNRKCQRIPLALKLLVKAKVLKFNFWTLAYN